MNVASKPLYFMYFTQDINPFFSKIWAEKLKALMADLAWIDELERRDSETYSRDYDHDDFPNYWVWPQSWRNAYGLAESEASLAKKELLKSAEAFTIDNDDLYIFEDENKVWFSTSSYDNGTLMQMQLQTGKNEHEFDSVVTAAYAFINDFNEWKQAHGKAYEMANILSKIERPFTDSIVGTTQECDQCGGYARIVKEESGNAICCHCVSAN
jgi:hypothetical protein